MHITYTATPSTAAETETYYTLKNLTPEEGSSSIADLSTDNYPPDRIPLKDANGYDMPNPANQIIFKNQPVSWWISGINSKSIVYTPVSNTVNWSYVAGETQYHILFETSSFMIPNRTDKVDRHPVTNMTIVTLVDNGVFNMSQTYNMF
jgi:hypothetical protein